LREPLSPEHRGTLLALARQSIAHGLAHGQPIPVRVDDYPTALREVLASFVTLELGGRLRGCVGSLLAHLPLVEDVALHAYDAAFRDARFAPVTAGETPRLEVHVSVLSPHEPIAIRDEEDLLRQLRPGVDGLVIAQGRRRATFLPSVWESLPDPAAFLHHLKLKAGIGPAPAAEPLLAWRYTTESFSEAGPEEVPVCRSEPLGA
jgi:hypothetical protein